ncbi:F-box domain protein [Aspergillus bombycis]|uniref:F-box domain protein n=1 Tax=Aspergillus bombycis TaxID=109264 RepID=A0A1F8A7W3_9EURO|nr:F-box domain protein [Aspergillus bombycis]OGM47509.1 F-box domain protein [Aspergillus bombycis]
MANKTSFISFRHNFYRKKIQLTEECLQAFVDVTQKGWLGCHLQHLTVMDMPAGDVQILAEQRAVTLLRRALTNLLVNSGHGLLQSLTLTIETEANTEAPWRSVWEAAATLFRVTTVALGRSKLHVEALDIFCSIDRCSLACGEIAKVCKRVNMSESLKNIKTISLSLSHQQTRRQPNTHMLPAAIGRGNTHAITCLLNMCPKLESLHLHWYNLELVNLTQAQKEEQHFFDRIADSCPIARLKQCTLQGIYTSEEKLHYFLRRRRLRSLTMEQIRPDSGSFQPIFEYLSLNMRRLRYLHFDDFWEDKLLYFDGPGQPHFPSTNGPNLPNSITRNGRETRRLIRYCFSVGGSLVSAGCRQWMEKHWRLYGPQRAVYA